MEDEDNEVVFEGHPLDQYLQQIGFKEYETATRADQKICQTAYQKQDVSSKIGSMWPGVNVRKYITLEWWGIGRLDSATLHEVIDVIAQSKLLTHEDFQLISSLDIHKKNQQRLSWHILPLGGLLGMVSWALESPLAVLGVPALVYAMVRWSAEWYHRSCVQAVTTLVEKMRELQLTSRKVLRFIQENELIARGFLFTVTGSAVDRLENSSLPSLARRWHTLPSLRESLASTLSATLCCLIRSTQTVVHQYPLRGQLDKQQFYLAFQDTDFCAGLNNLDNNAGVGSEEVKIELLKVLQNYYLLLQSEFLRRLALTFHPELRADAKSVSLNIVSELVDRTSKLANQLSTEYGIFSNYGKPSSAPPSERLENVKTSKLKYDGLFLSVHSTTLHLQNILYRTRAVEEYLEARENVSASNSNILIEHLQVALSDILKELDMCRSCCEQGELFLNSLANPETVENLTKEEDLSAKCLNINETVKLIPVGKTDLDPEVEDEVFEAISTKEYFQDADDSFDTAVYSKTEKQQKNCSKLMLDELKSVLVDKAREWQERERRALENKRSKEGQNKTGSTVNESDLLGVSAVNNITEKISPVEIADATLSNHSHDSKQENRTSVRDNFSPTKDVHAFTTTLSMTTEQGKPENEFEEPDSFLVPDVYVSKIKLSPPLGLQAVPLSHKLMLKESETFYGTGENSSSEDSGHE